MLVRIKSDSVFANLIIFVSASPDDTSINACMAGHVMRVRMSGWGGGNVGRDWKGLRLRGLCACPTCHSPKLFVDLARMDLRKDPFEERILELGEGLRRHLSRG